MELVIEVYKLTDQFPRSELYGLTSQMGYSAISIPSDIAEGKRRGSRKDYRQFLVIAYSFRCRTRDPNRDS
jgi:four helix bundle protein